MGQANVAWNNFYEAFTGRKEQSSLATWGRDVISSRSLFAAAVPASLFPGSVPSFNVRHDAQRATQATFTKTAKSTKQGRM